MIKKIFKIFVNTSILKSLYFNIKYFGIKGLIFPVLIGHKVELKKLKGKIIIENMKPGNIKFGIYCPGNYPNSTTSSFSNSGIMYFKQKASFGKGFRITNKGYLEIGNNFLLTAASLICCEEKIIFKNNCNISWNCEIYDTDFHKIYNENGELINKPKAIFFGEKNWICSGTKILKGCKFNNETIIAANSCISNKTFDLANIIVAEHGKIINKNIKWEL